MVFLLQSCNGKILKNAKLLAQRRAFYLDKFSTVHTETICMRFHLDPLSRALSNRCLFYESARPSSVDGRPKRIVRYAFSNENILMWTGLSFDGTVNYLKSSSALCLWL